MSSELEREILLALNDGYSVEFFPRKSPGGTVDIEITLRGTTGLARRSERGFLTANTFYVYGLTAIIGLIMKLRASLNRRV